MSARTPRWALTEPLRQWQIDALNAWKLRGYRGVVEAATGTGKTRLALAAMVDAHERNPLTKVAIVVPSLVLAEQWRAALTSLLAIDPKDIDEYHSNAVRPTGGGSIILAVINSARDQLPALIAKWHSEDRPSLLVVDECHRAGSESNRRVFETAPTWTLGLSATPERDDGDETFVYQALGDVCYRYHLAQALDDSVLAPVTSINLYVDFTTAEQAEWHELSAAVGSLSYRLRAEHDLRADSSTGHYLRQVRQLSQQGNTVAIDLLGTIVRRTHLVRAAANRHGCLSEIAKWASGAGSHMLIFHELIAEAERCRETFAAAGVPTSLEHSNLPGPDRAAALDAFRSGDSRALVVVRAVDEGVDVPEAAWAIIAAGSRSKRQRIQRIGRVLRSLAGKRAVVVSILVRGTPEEHYIGLRDAELLGAARVRHHYWTPGDLVSILAEPTRASTYQPASTPGDLADALVRTELDIAAYDEAPVARRQAPPVVTSEIQRNGWLTVDDAVARLGAPRQWVMRQLPSIRAHAAQRIGKPPSGDHIHAVEFDDLRSRWERSERTPPAGIKQPGTHGAVTTSRRPAAVAKLKRGLTADDVLAAAEHLNRAGGVPPTRRVLAQELQVSEQEINDVLRGQPLLAFRIRQLAGSRRG